VGIDAAAPVYGFEALGVSFGGNLFGFGLGAMVAPEVVLVEWLEVFVDGDDAGAGGVEGDGDDAFAGHAGLFKNGTSGADEGLHLVVVGLGSEVRIFALAVERILGRCSADGALLAMDESDADTEGSEIDASDDGHGDLRVNAY
jgi:hypothetical protein